jgi:hypothetical protein
MPAAAASATCHAPSASLAAPLAALEARLDGPPHRALGIAPTATVVDACTAFAVLAARFHPRHHGGDPTLEAQLRRASRRLRGALLAFARARAAGPPRELDLLRRSAWRSPSPAR